MSAARLRPFRWDGFRCRCLRRRHRRGPAAINGLLGQEALHGNPVMFVAGNREYYGGLLQHTAMLIRGAAIGTNVTFLNGDIIAVIDGVRFLGCTLWTDFSFPASSQLAGLQAGMRFNDCLSIMTADGGEFPRPFVSKEALRRHLVERRWLEDRLAEPHDGPTVCITYHGVHPRGPASTPCRGKRRLRSFRNDRSLSA